MTGAKEALVGVWVDKGGTIHRGWRSIDGHVYRETQEAGRFWLWATEGFDADSGEIEALKGAGRWNRLWSFGDFETYVETVRERDFRSVTEVLKPFEHQVLIAEKQRLFVGLGIDGVTRCQVDIETSCGRPGGFSDPTQKEDRVLAIGMRMRDKEVTLELEEETDQAERALLKLFGETLRKWNPDIVEGHNIFRFDLNFIKTRCRRFRVKTEWGRFGAEASFRNSRMRIAERWIDFPRCDIPGRTVIDTYLLVQVYDITARSLPGYGLKDVAIGLGVTTPDDNRTYIEGDAIAQVYREDREQFRAYLLDDLRETAGVADILLPTYLAQTQGFPILLQEATLRGTGGKVDLLFLDRYFHAKQALPDPLESHSFEGAFSHSFETGVFRHVLHYDVASLYPSLLLLIDRGPAADDLNAFIPMLRELRSERLEYKRLAKTADTDAERREYDARQSSYKILINSFYGYLGFPGAKFGDSDLAGEVTRRGRELLQTLVDTFRAEGCTVLEADTDGIYVSSETYFDKPEDLLARVSAPLPEGIDLEFDGSYSSMFCYKAKNYALAQDGKITIKGSALRSRGIEPILKDLTDSLLRYVLGLSTESPVERAEALEKEIDQLALPVERVVKTEFLSQNPETYRKVIEGGGKPRRASLEVALRLNPQPRMGDPVTYFLGLKEKGQTADWQRAQPVDAYDPITCPYDAKAYKKKIKDWLKRYAEFL